MSESNTNELLHERYVSDRGDETQRNFRYQHAYGAILLIAGAYGTKPYAKIWCEHHEDLLAERNDQTFDAYQIKTRQPEIGYWNITDEEIRKSLKRFVQLNSKFTGKINSYNIVSNTNFLDCGPNVKEETLKRSPIKFLECIKDTDKIDLIPEPFYTVFKNLSGFCECSEEDLFTTLKITFFTVGPARDSFDAEISSSHLIQLDECKSLPMTSINQIRDEIIHSVYDASSLKVDDPYKHLYDHGSTNINPIILSKCVNVASISQRINGFKETPFRYQPHDLTLKIGQLGQVNFDVLSSKFLAGHLNDQLTTMKRRTISAEGRLLELTAMDAREAEKILLQLESYVQAECDEALNDIQVDKSNIQDKPFGQTMFHNVSKRLKEITTGHPDKVFNESYETLMGVAGLLTERCSVWWSEKFKITDAS